MTLGITLLIIFIPIIAIFIGTYFTTITEFLSSALSTLEVVPVIAQSVWAVLPSQITSLIIGIVVITFSVWLLQRIIG